MNANKKRLQVTAPQTLCPACGHHVSVPFLDVEEQPLATVAWPSSAEEAKKMERLPLEFVRCVSCGHVYNCRFEYDKVPYSRKPNRMFNRGEGWKKHLQAVRDLLIDRLSETPNVVEIGCGGGETLRLLSEARPKGRFIGFDPNGDIATDGVFELRHEFFDPREHLPQCKPDLLISRHLLEHLNDPLDFLQRIAFEASCQRMAIPCFIEAPCIDRALETERTSDFYYEHKSHFTSQSFRRMLEESGGQIELIDTAYNQEVIFGLLRFSGDEQSSALAGEAARFRASARKAAEIIRRQLNELCASGERVAIWGGTGKAAAFINHYSVDAQRFPLVVDSDHEKVGTYVPGMGQRIRARDELRSQPADVIIIPMQWRARDVIAEIHEAGLTYRQILIEHESKLVDFFLNAHPY